jgi:hypothetical protein
LRRTLIIVVVTVAIIGAVAYAASTFDLAGIIVRAHAPPAH